MSLIAHSARENIEASGAEESNPISLMTVGGNDYYVHYKASHRVSLSPPLFHDVPSRRIAKDWVACTVVSWGQDHFTDDNLSTVAANFASRDDVWSPAFLAGKISRNSGSLEKFLLMYAVVGQSLCFVYLRASHAM